MTMDNEEAEIIVADNIPFLTRQETTSANIDYSSYEFKDVGTTLKITPQINQERFVRLEIYNQLAQVVDQEQAGLPTTLKREAKTTVVIRDGHTVVIGGLIDETLSQTMYKTPCLGNVPFFGWLFKSKLDQADRTNLFIFITPHIVENPHEASAIYRDKKKNIDDVRLEGGVIKMYKKPSQEDDETGVEGAEPAEAEGEHTESELPEGELPEGEQTESEGSEGAKTENEPPEGASEETE
jgi:general secretion pathway protein D